MFNQISIHQVNVDELKEKIAYSSNIEEYRKVTLQDIMRISGVFTEDNPQLFELYLALRPDIQGEERQLYLDLIWDLKQKEEQQIKHFLEKINTSNSKST